MPTVRTGDIDTYYERRGEGPPVVFVHGAIVDHGQWTPQLEALDDAYTTVAYDVRGHGRTGGSDRTPYTVGLFADDLDALLGALDLDRPVLCGLSMGGCIAQVYAATRPERIAGLVLADTFTPSLLDWRDRLQFYALRATVPPVRLVGYARVERAMLWLHERFGDVDRGDYEAIERLRAESPKMATDEFAKVIGALTRFHGTDLDHSTITAPTLVLYGDRDTGFVRRHSRKLGATLPNATLRTVPDAGHVSNLDNPEFFTASLREFLAGLRPSDG